MRFKKFMIILVIFVIFVGSFITISSKDAVELVKGKNHVELNISQPFYVETLMKLNPSIEVASYQAGEETIGYVNVFKGVGKNFIVDTGEYEIIVKENTTLVLPY